MATYEEFCLLLVLYFDANIVSNSASLKAMKISCFCKKCFRRKTPIFHMTSILALTCTLHMSEAECKVEFRFDKKGLPVLAEVFQIPP